VENSHRRIRIVPVAAPFFEFGTVLGKSNI
jgi:hypothetical protein